MHAAHCVVEGDLTHVRVNMVNAYDNSGVYRKIKVRRGAVFGT